MGWKGMMRSIIAAQRRALKESERQERQRIKAELAQQREMRSAEVRRILRTDQEHADVKKSWFDTLLSLHMEASDPIDWVSIANQPRPQISEILVPDLSTEYEDAARRDLSGYQPSAMDKLLGRDKKRRAELSTAIDEARMRDKERHHYALQQKAIRETAYQKELNEWEQQVTFAGKVLEGDTEAWEGVVQDEGGVLGQITGLGQPPTESKRDQN